MVKKPKKYMIPSGYGGLLHLEEELKSKIKIKPQHVAIISVIIGFLILILRLILI